MSNDRLLIMCHKCNRFMIWGKYYPSCRTGRGCEDGKIDAFIDAHVESCWPRPDYQPFDLEGETMFQFITENAAPDNAKWELA